MLAKVGDGFKGRGPPCLQIARRVGYMAPVHRLLAYLRDNVFIDFQGDLDLEKVRELLGDDGSREARALLARLTRAGGTDDMMVTLADCLLEVVQTALTDDVMREQLQAYIEA